MKLAKTLILTSSLAFVPMVWSQQASTTSAAPAAKSWAGSYMGVTLGRSQGERRTVSSGSSSSYSTLTSGSPAYCWNVQSESVVTGQLDQASCLTSGNQGSRVWYPATSPVVDSTERDSSFNEHTSSRQRNTVGLKAGHNWQKDGDRVVYGLEADYTQLRNQNNAVSASASSAVNTTNLTTTTTLNGGVSWVSTARARIGYANQDNTVLPYLTAGVAWGRIKTQGTVSYSGSLQDSSQQFNDSSIKSGLVLGGGLDYRIDKNLVLNLSYMRAKLGAKRTLFTDGQSNTSLMTAATAGASGASIDPYVNLAAIGLSYKFD